MHLRNATQSSGKSAIFRKIGKFDTKDRREREGPAIFSELKMADFPGF